MTQPVAHHDCESNAPAGTPNKLHPREALATLASAHVQSRLNFGLLFGSCCAAGCCFGPEGTLQGGQAPPSCSPGFDGYFQTQRRAGRGASADARDELRAAPQEGEPAPPPTIFPLPRGTSTTRRFYFVFLRVSLRIFEHSKNPLAVDPSSGNKIQARLPLATETSQSRPRALTVLSRNGCARRLSCEQTRQSHECILEELTCAAEGVFVACLDRSGSAGEIGHVVGEFVY